MKIAILSPGIEPQHERLQPYRTLLEMGDQLARLGYQVLVISDNADRLPSRDCVFGLEVHRLQSVRQMYGQPNFELLSKLTEQKIELLFWHVSLSSFYHQNLSLSVPIPTIAVLTSPIHRPKDILNLGAKKLSSNMDLIGIQMLGAFVPGFLIRKSYQYWGLRGMITFSESTRNYLINQGLPRDCLWVAPPGVGQKWLDNRMHNEERQHLRLELGYREDDFIVTYFGSPAPVRGVFTMLDAVEETAQAFPQIRLMILSRRTKEQWGRETVLLSQEINRKGLKGHVSLIDGFLEENQLIRHIIASDVICLPFEILPSDVPLSVLEAMALAKSVIATEVGCIPELLGDQRGFLARPGSVRSLTEQLKLVLSTPALAKARGEKGRDFVEKHRTWKRMGEALENVITLVRDSYKTEKEDVHVVKG